MNLYEENFKYRYSPRKFLMAMFSLNTMYFVVVIRRKMCSDNSNKSCLLTIYTYNYEHIEKDKRGSKVDDVVSANNTCASQCRL